jgi:CheY-like chemotaxis protein
MANEAPVGRRKPLDASGWTSTARLTLQVAVRPIDKAGLRPGQRSQPDSVDSTGSLSERPTACLAEDRPHEHGQILVALNDPALCALLSDCLVERGYGVTSAYNGVQMVSALRSDRPDLVLLGEALAGADAAAQNLRALAAESRPEIIMISGTLDSGPESAAVPIVELDRLLGMVASTMARVPAPFREGVGRPFAPAG